jgi:hypothetical protein
LVTQRLQVFSHVLGSNPIARSRNQRDANSRLRGRGKVSLSEPLFHEQLLDCRSFTVSLLPARACLEMRANLPVSGALDPPVITKDMA